jgi:hypothetical protein
MRTTYRVLAWTVAAGVVWQAAGVGWAFFSVLLEVEDGAVVTTGYDWGGNAGIMMHRIGGMGLIPLACLALLVVSFFTQVAGAVRWALIVLGLFVVQFGLVVAAFETAAAGALHGANALVLFAAAVWAGHRVRRVDPQPSDRALDRTAA